MILDDKEMILDELKFKLDNLGNTKKAIKRSGTNREIIVNNLILLQ